MNTRVEHIRERPEAERTPEEKGKLKAFEDQEWQTSRRYDYEDDWSNDNGDAT